MNLWNILKKEAKKHKFFIQQFYPATFLSTYLSIYLTFYLSIFLSIFLSIYLSINISIYPSFYINLKSSKQKSQLSNQIIFWQKVRNTQQNKLLISWKGNPTKHLCTLVLAPFWQLICINFLQWCRSYTFLVPFVTNFTIFKKLCKNITF